MSLGTSSDRIGTPEGPKCYYLTVAKSLPNGRFAPYASLNYSEHDDEFNVPFGLNYRLGGPWTALYMHDGRRDHLLVAFAQEKWSASLLWVWFRHPGIALSWSF